MKATLLALAAMLACVTAGPMRLMHERIDTCAITCKPSLKFSYTSGQTFIYDYTVQTETSVDGASEEHASLSISGQANIEVIDQCEMVLQLRRMVVHESSPSESGGRLVVSPSSQQLSQVLENTPLRFSFQDGVVESLCPDKDEDPWALNVKRGVLSALQNSMDFQDKQSQSVKEKDVTGHCVTVYEVKDKSYWGKTSIRRHKDLQACTEREGFLGGLHTSHFQTDPSGLQSLPLMQSEHECNQEVSEGIVQNSVCTEKHLFRPFSAQQGGAQTTVVQTLTFKSRQRGISSRKDWIDSRAEMTFDHGYSVKDSSEARARTETLLAQLCQMTMDGVQPDVPRVFAQLVQAVKKLDSSDIREVYRQLQRQTLCSLNNQRTKKFFLDALPMAASSEAVDLMKDLMIAGDVTGFQVDLYLASMAFIPEPTAEMIDSVKELLETDQLKGQAMLAVSSMLHAHCQKKGCSSGSVDRILDLLSSAINYRCSVNDGNIKTVLVTLKALGNAGHPKTASVINRCLGNRVPLEVRVAAAQAYRRLPCDVNQHSKQKDQSRDRLRGPLTDIAEDKGEDSELRIMSYLQLMTCPSRDLLGQVQLILQEEPEDSQVGSFIHSHLNNLKETSSPLKQDIKQMLKDLDLSKLFHSNPLKFSRNYEKSAFLKAINSGAQAESHVIFSAQSPVPRSVTANLTVDVLGHSINLLEIGARLEGVEYLVESLQAHFFGDGKGQAPKNKLDELKGSGYARIFGNELLYNRFQGLKSLTSGKSFNLLDFLIRLSKDHDYSFTQSLQFVDSTLTTPTAGGLPLTLSVNGTATVDVRAKGKMDLRKVSKTPRTLHVEGEIRPSGAVNVDGVMSVDGLLTGTGLKVSSSLHSSLAIKGRVELDRGRTLNVQLDVPDDKMNVLDARTKFFILHNKAESEQKMITDNRREYQLCTGSFLSSVTGLEMCGELQFPNASMQSDGPYFPLTGPASVSLVLHKRDSHSGYKLLAKRVENKRSSIAQLSFDTPGSSVVRAVSFDMMIDYPQKEMEISFASPWKKTSVKGSLVSEAGLKSVTGSVVIDDDLTYALTTELKVDEQSDSSLTIFTPMVQLRRPGADDVTLMGDVKVDNRWKLFSVDLTLNGITKKPLQLQTSYTNTQSEKGVSGTFKHGRRTYSAQAGVTHNVRNGKSGQLRPLVLVTTPRGELLRMDGQTNWKNGKMFKSDHTLTIPDLLDVPVNLKCDIKKKGRRNRPRYEVSVRLKSRPFTGKVHGVMVLADTSFNLKVDYEGNKVGRDRITITGKLSNRSTGAFKKYIVSSTVEFKRNPSWNVDTTLDLEHKKRRSEGSLTVILGKNRKSEDQKVTLSASLARNIKSVSDAGVDYKMKAIVPMLGVDYSLNGAHKHSSNSLNSQTTFKYAKDQSITAEVNLKGNLEKQMRVNGDVSLSFPGHKYEVDSDLRKKGKQLVHILNLKTHNGPLLALTSTYKPAKDRIHEVTSNVDIQGYKPVKMSGMVGLDWNNLQLQGEAISDKDSYSLNALSKVSRGPRGKWVLEASYPGRSVAFGLSGGLQRSSADLDLDLDWDKGKDKDAKISLSASGSHKSTEEFTSTSGKLDLISPCMNKLSAAVSLDNDLKRYGLDSKVTWGPKSNSYFSNFNVIKPLSPSAVQMTWNAGSPIRGWKRLYVSLDHSADPSSLSSTLKASRGKDQLQLTVTGKDNSYSRTSDMIAKAGLTSNIRDLGDVSLALAHKDDGRKYTSSATFMLNEDKYSAELGMSHIRNGWQVQNSGDLKLTSPSRDVTTKWEHSSSADDVSSTFTTEWDRGQKLQVALTGDKKMTDQEKNFNGALTVQTPWKPVRDLSVTMNHKMSDSHCEHEAVIIRNGEKKASQQFSYRFGRKEMSGGFVLTNPFMETKSGSMNVKYMSYPVTVHGELQLGPRSTITTDASFSKTGDRDMEGNMRVTTPFTDLRTITVSGSTKSDREDVVAKANVDYGIRQNYDAMITFRPQTFTLGRVVIHTPLAQFSSLDAGYQISGDQKDFSAAADFSLQPAVDKYSASLSWQLDQELSGKVRINTPIRELRYMQMTVNSKMSGQGRRSRVEVEYYPRQMYALTSFYTSDMPIIFALKAETPIEGYDSFGVSLKHQHDEHSVSTHGELQYLPDKVVESTLNMNWERNIDGSLVVKTPFPDFKESKLSVRHDGELDNFKTHAEMEIMHETMTADAQFKYGYTIAGSFSFESSMKDMAKVEASFNKRGNSDNFRSSASAAFGDQKIEGTLTHKLSSRMLKTAVTFKSPFTKLVKASVDMSNKQGDMQADISGQYGPKKVDSTSSLTIDDSDFSATSSIKYKLDGSSEKQMQAALSKKGGLKNLAVLASLSSPFTEDISVSVEHTCDLPFSLKTTVSASFGQDYTFKSVNSFNNVAPTFSASSANSYRMGGPLQEASASVIRKGVDLKDMSFTSTAKYGDKEISVEGEINTENSIRSILRISTPFPRFERLGVAFTHVPEDNGFQQQGSLTYETDKTVQYSISFNCKDLDQIQVDASVQSPIQFLEKQTLKIRHDYKKNGKECTGLIQIQCPVVGKAVLNYKRIGSLEQMTLEATMELNGEKVQGYMEWVPLSHGYKHSMELKAPRESTLTSSTEIEMTDDRITIKTMTSLPPASISFEGEGVLNGFNAQIDGKFLASTAMFKDVALLGSLKRTGSPDDFTLEMETGFDSMKFTATGNFKNEDGDLSGKLNIKTPFKGYEDFGGSFKHSGDLNRFSSEASQFVNGEEITGKVTFYRYQWKRLEATAELRGPSEVIKAEYRHAGSDDGFTCSSSFQFNNDKASSDLRVTLKPKYDITLTIKTPFDKYEKLVAEAKLEKMGNTRSASGSLDLGHGQRYTVEGSLEADSSSLMMNGKLMTPIEMLNSVEVSSSFEGEINDFVCSVVFNSPLTDVIKYDSTFKYTSPFDANVAVSVSSRICYMEDLRVEVKNADMGNSKNGHVLLRWAPQKQVSLDGSYMLKDAWYNKDMQADFTLTTPFQKVRTANLHVQYEQKDRTCSPKMDLSINGESLLDIEGELTTGNNPSVSILTRSPRSTQVTATLSRDGHDIEIDVFINWDRDQNDKHVRLQTKAKDIRDDYQTNLGYSLKVIHPSHTLSTGVTLLNKGQKVTSEGYLALDDRADRKIFYTLDFNDNSNYYGKAYDITIKLGVPGRTLETTGSYSRERQTSTVDATFSWDADRDFSKLVGVNAKVTGGEKTKTDLTLRLPAISKEVHVDHEMTLNQGLTVWDTKTAVSYSPDVQRTLTLTSSLKDISSSYSSGKNYSLAVSISHPHTNTDVTFNSHIGAVGDRLSAAMDTVYMTSRRTRLNMMLRGEIDRLRRQIDFQLDSPVKKMTMHGQVESTEPYVIRLTNTYDQDDVIQSKLKIDMEKKALLFITNYNLDKPQDQVIVKAGYLNSSALSAELYSQQDGQNNQRSEGKAIVVLKTPTLIQAGLGWRPEDVEDLQRYMQRKTTTYSDRLRHTLDTIIASTGQEVSDKYAAITEELQSELYPLLDLFEGELVQLGQQMDRARKALNRMYRRNNLHMQDMGQYVLQVIELMKEYSASYKTAYDSLLRHLRAGLQDMSDYNIRQHYQDAMDSLAMRFKMSLARSMEGLEELAAMLEEQSREWWTNGQDHWEQIKNHPGIQQLHGHVQRLGQDYKWLMGYLGKRAARMSLPEHYTSAIYGAHEKMMNGLYSAMDNSHVQKVKNVANEAYQQGAWAYQYWNVEKNVRKVPQRLVELVMEFLAQEFHELNQQLKFVSLTNVTVYDPEHGRVQVDLVLPFQLKSLQELPDWRAYLQEAENLVDNYLPDKATVVDMYQKYAPWADNKTTPDDDIMSQFEAYRPARSRRGRYSKRTGRVHQI